MSEKTNYLKIVLIGVAGWAFYSFVQQVFERMMDDLATRYGWSWLSDSLWQSATTVLVVLVVFALMYKKTNVFKKIIGR